MIDSIKSFIQKIKDKMIDNKGKIFLVSFVIFLCLFSFVLIKLTMQKTAVKVNQSEPLVTSGQPQVISSVSVAPKVKPSDPDLVVKQKYIAKINDKIIEVPLSKPKETKDPSTGQTAVVSQTLDVTSAVKPIIPRWSIGVGIGRYHSETYIPISVSRHYKPLKRSLQFTLKYSIDKRKITGGEIQHLWSF